MLLLGIDQSNIYPVFLFYSPRIEKETIILDGDDHQHCTRVLRYSIGHSIYITDGCGHFYKATIKEIHRNETWCLIESTRYDEPSSHPVAIAISPTKTPARIEWFVEKAVEIGIDEIFIFVGHRTEKKTTNTQRIEKIALSAMKQSLQTYLPKISAYPDLKSLLKSSEHYQQKMIAHMLPGTKALRQVYRPEKSGLVLIGPEGDFTTQEIEHCVANGFVGVSLGSNRLRTETAGLVALMSMKISE